MCMVYLPVINSFLYFTAFDFGWLLLWFALIVPYMYMDNRLPLVVLNIVYACGSGVQLSPSCTVSYFALTVALISCLGVTTSVIAAKLQLVHASSIDQSLH